jgi:hypothetical protein
MPLMGWDTFRDTHHRPFMILAHLDAAGPEARFASLQQLIDSMGLTGNFALYMGEDFIRAAFELEADALQVVQTFAAQETGRGDEWAGQWAFYLDGAVTARMATLLRPLQR